MPKGKSGQQYMSKNKNWYDFGAGYSKYDLAANKYGRGKVPYERRKSGSYMTGSHGKSYDY